MDLIPCGDEIITRCHQEERGTLLSKPGESPEIELGGCKFNCKKKTYANAPILNLI
jgi:hypothetical protein